MKYINELALKGKKVFIRGDLDVPIAADGTVADDHRLQALAPTVRYALEQGAAVIVAGHLGRPDGKRVESMSAKPAGARLSQLIDCEITVADDCIGEAVERQAAALVPGQVLMLENLRFHKGEEKNDPEFAKQLAALADIYVNNAFATAHRAHASTAGVVPLFAQAAAGFVLQRELEYFDKALTTPQRPLVAIFGGAKISGKLKAITNVAKRADIVIVGGAMANTFFAAQGHSVGKSLYEKEQLEIARSTQESLAASSCQLLLPVDVIIAAEMKGGVPTRTVPIQEIPSDMMALDIGPRSVELFREALQKAKTIVWNGPMGAFEIKEFSSGTFGVVDALVESKALTVVGGGDTDLALEQRHAMDKMDFVSTAGGAFLTLLEGSPLPAIDALNGK